ncbi:MAG: hypothetical protein ACUVQT_01935 [bacterium]
MSKILVDIYNNIRGKDGLKIKLTYLDNLQSTISYGKKIFRVKQIEAKELMAEHYFLLAHNAYETFFLYDKNQVPTLTKTILKFKKEVFNISK